MDHQEEEMASEYTKLERDEKESNKQEVKSRKVIENISKIIKFKKKTTTKFAINFKNQISLLRNKSILFILFWNIMIFGYQYTFIRLLFGDYSHDKSNYWLTTFPVLSLFFVVSDLLYPLAGWLTDTKLGRYRVMKYSIWLMWMSSGIALVSRIVDNANYMNTARFIVIAVLTINIIALSGFNVNVVLFGIDHLTDASNDQSRAFIHWYYWSRNVSFTLISGMNILFCKITPTNKYSTLISLIVCASCLSMAMVVDFNFGHLLKRTQERANPFAIIRRVLYYTFKKRNSNSAEHRSAFTYNESYHPKRIDFAKDIYGGPFKSDQVEDVKTFINMLKAITAIGIFSLFYVLNYSSIEYFIKRVHVDNSTSEFDEECFPSDNIYWIFNPLAITVFIPLYQLLLAPCLDRYIPRTLKRVGIAVVVILIAFVFILALELIGAIRTKTFYQTEHCSSLNKIPHPTTTSGVLHINIWLVLIPTILTTIAELLGNIASLEFICAQSPSNFKGFMMGLLYAVQGLFNGIASIIILPFTSSQSSLHYKTIHCPGGYFALQIGLGIGALILYVVIVRQYSPRQRNLVANERQMIESHFENMFDQREKHEENRGNISVHID